MQTFFDASGSSLSASSSRLLARGDQALNTSSSRSRAMRAASAERPRSLLELFVVFILLALLLIIVVFFTVQVFYRGRGVDDAWSRLFSKVASPDGGAAPAAPQYPSIFRVQIAGVVHGQSFTPERVTYSTVRNSLTFWQGRGRLPDSAVEIVIDPGKKLQSGLLIEVNSRSDANVPRVYVKWKDPLNEILQSRMLSSGSVYTMTLRITGVSPEKISGLISFTAIEVNGTNFSGMFEASYD